MLCANLKVLTITSFSRLPNHTTFAAQEITTYRGQTKKLKHVPGQALEPLKYEQQSPHAEKRCKCPKMSKKALTPPKQFIVLPKTVSFGEKDLFAVFLKCPSSFWGI